MSVFRLSGRDLACIRGERPVFADVNFSLSSGEALIVRGQNGCGKTSLLRMAAGLLPPAHGAIYWNGQAKRASGLQAELNFIGHDIFLKPSLTLCENLAFWNDLCGRARPLDWVMEQWKLEKQAQSPGRYLSRGQKQRALLSLLFLKPSARIWILDEPAEGLDSQARFLLTKFIARHREKGGAVMMSSHTVIQVPNARQMHMGEDD